MDENAPMVGGMPSTGERGSKRKAPNMWIMKPAGSSRGRGIQVVNDVGSVHYGELTIIQQYISNPLLLGGFKWDMRVYVTVTSFNPLEAFIYKDCLCGRPWGGAVQLVSGDVPNLVSEPGGELYFCAPHRNLIRNRLKSAISANLGTTSASSVVLARTRPIWGEIGQFWSG